MKKQEIEKAALSGIGVDAHDVVRVRRDKRVVTYRHTWDDCDGRAWAAIRAVVGELAQELADATRHRVEVYSRAGSFLDEYLPAHEEIVANCGGCGDPVTRSLAAYSGGQAFCPECELAARDDAD